MDLTSLRRALRVLPLPNDRSLDDLLAALRKMQATEARGQNGQSPIQ